MSSTLKRSDLDKDVEGASSSSAQSSDDAMMLVVPANKSSSDSTSTTAATATTSMSSSTISTPLLSNPTTDGQLQSLSINQATAAAAAATQQEQGQGGAVDNEPPAPSSSSPITQTTTATISSLREQGQQLLNTIPIGLKPEHLSEAQQLMTSLKEQGQAVYLQLSDEATKAVAALSLSGNSNINSSSNSGDDIASSLQQPTLSSTRTKSDHVTSAIGEEKHGQDSNNDLDLKQTYPLSLQRSASSAFGSPPRTSSTDIHQNKGRTRRSHSNSGHISDPGIALSAFHPVWSCKSLSTSSSVSGSNIDGSSEVGSAVSSSIAASTIRSAHSDPFPSIFPYDNNATNTSSTSTTTNKKKSPWRLFKKKIKNKTNNNNSSSPSNRERWASFSKREQLGGRENPHGQIANLKSNVDVEDDTDIMGEEEVTVGGIGGDESQVITPSAESTSESKSKACTKKNRNKKKKKKSKKSLSKSSSGSFASSSASTTTKKPSKRQQQQQSVNVPSSKSNDDDEQYDDPGVALDLSDDSDNEEEDGGGGGEGEDDDTFEPILGNEIPDDRPSSIIPPSQLGNNIRAEKKKRSHDDYEEEDLCGESVEVISSSVGHGTPTPLFGRETPSYTTIMENNETVQIFAANSIDENSPPSVERVAPYHPLGGDEERRLDGDHPNVNAHVQGSSSTSNAVLQHLKYQSPQRSSSSHPSSSTTTSSGLRGIATTNNQQHSPSSSNGSPVSRLSGGSPSSRISSSNSRTSASASTLNSGGDRTINTLHSAEGSLVMDSTDYEIREANRRSGVRGRVVVGGGGEANNHPEVVVPGQHHHDSNDTVISSSTTSSNYHAYLSSPRPLRDGATMPVERFFAGGNVAMSPSPQKGMNSSSYPMSSAASSGDNSSTASPSISKFLSPKKLTRIGASGMSSSTSSSKGTAHSPHTVSSNSVSANSSSSGSETKKPLKFVAYEIREERESPFDEPRDEVKYDSSSRYAAAGGGVGAVVSNRGSPPSNSSSSSLIKPRIFNPKTSQRRPPMIQRAGNPQKPPQSPRRPDTTLSVGRARTPTRTPPPSSYREMPSSGANTPCSPPVIVDGPSNAAVLCSGDLNTKPTRPFVVRRSISQHSSGSGGPGMFLITPTARPHHHPPIPPQPRPSSAAISSSLRADMTIVGEEDSAGMDDGKHEVVMVVSPEMSTLQSTARRSIFSKEEKGQVGDSTKNVAVVSPEKG